MPAVGGVPTAVTGGDDYEIRLWNVVTGELIAAMAGHTDNVLAVACGHIDNSAIAISVGGGDRHGSGT